MSLRDESGVVLVFTAVLLLVLMGFAALAVDLGNAWSNDQRVQTATDVASVGALQVIPHTFLDGYAGNPPEGGAETVARTEALDLIAVNNAVPGAVDVDLALDGGNVSVAATATIDSDNAFARTIGAGGAITVDAAARAEVFANQPTVDLLPLGFADPTNPYRCISDPDLGPSGCVRAADPQPSTDLQIIGMRQRRTGCTDLGNTMERNLRDGADHLVDLAATGIRDEKEACDEGHPLTMPSTSQLVRLDRGDFSSYVTSGLGGRLSGNSNTLWDRLLPGLPGACDRIAIQALSDVQEQSALMAECLASGNAGMPRQEVAQIMWNMIDLMSP
jgi:hypothetical protein